MSGVWIVVGIVVVYAAFTFYRRRIANGGLGTARALRTLMQSAEEPYTIIDVRTPQEYRDGHIPTAINIPHDRIGTKLPRVDKDSLVVVYCHTGSRSMVARSVLSGRGFSRIVNFGRVGKWDGPLVQGNKPGELAAE